MDKLLIKFVANGAIVVILLMMLSEATFLESLITAVVLSLIAWFLGDQMILRKTNNWVATVSDAVLAFVVLWAAAAVADWNDLTFGDMLVVVAVLGVFEYFFHQYLLRDKDYQRGEPVA